ncbi:hypothetical protein BAY1663_03705 [Pseudomonas sp. BAY1663]|nr:hypothetical protein BAY1663_03705 [Pseudomonas sp. BAY1663]
MQLVEQRLEFVVGDMVARGIAGRLGRRLRCHGRRRRLELAFAMQLVEQRLELVVGDLVAGRRRSGLQLGRRSRARRGGELPLAMQLVEQQFEFVVDDLIGGGIRSSRHSRLLDDRLDRIEQLLELVIGGIGNRLRHGSRCRLLGGRRLGQARQGREQFGRSRGRFDALAHLGEHRIHRVQRLQDDVHQFGIDAPLALAQDVENVFGDVAALHQLVKLEETCAALDRVKTAKNRIEQRHVIGAALQLHELL